MVYYVDETIKNCFYGIGKLNKFKEYGMWSSVFQNQYSSLGTDDQSQLFFWSDSRPSPKKVNNSKNNSQSVISVSSKTNLMEC